MDGSRLLLKVDDRAARYPVTIDPWVQEAAFTGSDSVAEDGFGTSVAIDGGTMVVGAPCATFSSTYGACGAGAAYVFQITGVTATEVAKLTVASGGGGQFGGSVAISGNTIVVGAPYAAISFNSTCNCEVPRRGGAYVFVEPSGGWSDMAPTAVLHASDGGNGDLFGGAVAISGDTVVVGASCDPATITTTSSGASTTCGSGAAYLFLKPSDGWSSMAQTAEVAGLDSVEDDGFGSSVAIEGDTMVVGAPSAPCTQSSGANCGTAGPGTAYVFQVSDTTVTQVAEMTSSNGAENDQFGASVAIDGGTVVVGAPYATSTYSSTTNGWVSGPGAAYVFVEPANGWDRMIETARLTAGDGEDYDQFGNSVALGGNVLVVGANYSQFDYSDFTVGPGAVYIFESPSGSWSDTKLAAELAASDGEEHDGFGNSVAISGYAVVAGAPCSPFVLGNGCGTGTAYLFLTAAEISLSADPNNAAYDTPVTVTATVPGTDLAPSGTVNFYNNGNSIGSATLVDPEKADFKQSAWLSARR